MSNENKNKRFDAQEYVNRQLEMRTNAALNQKNKQFALEHAHDTDEQLLCYVTRFAKENGYTPHMNDIIGGGFIARRFGGWAHVIQMANLPKPGPSGSSKYGKIYKEELRAQTKLRKKEKERKKNARVSAKEENARIAQEERNLRKERDFAWGDEHADDTDEQLLDYVRECAAEMGQTPRMKEVLGGEYIRERIGGWALVCTLADIPLPRELKPPKAKEVQQYLQKQKKAAKINAE